VVPEEVTVMSTIEIPGPTQIDQYFDKFPYAPRVLAEDDTSLVSCSQTRHW
jgi:hypothetical protein